MCQLIEGAHELARSVLQQGRAKMDLVVERLLDIETIGADDLDALIAAADESSQRPAAG